MGVEKVVGGASEERSVWASLGRDPPTQICTRWKATMTPLPPNRVQHSESFLGSTRVTFATAG